MHRLAGFYSRRIVNVNVNIIIAGIVATLLTIIPVHLTHYFTDNHYVIVAITVVSDLIIDVTIYYALHWLANHWPRRGGGTPMAPPVISFFKDATLVQFERALLSPILYGVFLVLQFWLLRQGVEREWSAVIGLGSGILVTRTLHTLWMIRDPKNLCERISASPDAPCASVPSSTSTSAPTR